MGVEDCTHNTEMIKYLEEEEEEEKQVHDEKKLKNSQHDHNISTQLLLTGSKLATPITAPTMTTSTTPPATMLSKKFLSDGDNPESAASATCGITIEAVSAAAVNPVTVFSFREALTTNLPLDLGLDGDAAMDLEGRTGNGLKKASDPCSLFWALVKGVAIETGKVDTIFARPA